MKKIISTAMALVLSAGPALAGRVPVPAPGYQGDYHQARNDRQEIRQDHRDIRQEHRDIRRDERDLRRDQAEAWRHREWREHQDRDRPHYNYYGREYRAWPAPAWSPPPGYHYRRWARGERLPDYYWGQPRYYIDYRHYHLAPPPRGYRYVRVDNDVYLVAIASGLIAAGIFGLLYNQ